MSKYNDGLKTLLLQGLSEPEFYGDLVYKFRKIIGKNDFPYHFKKIVVHYKKIGYSINVMRQTACLVVNKPPPPVIFIAGRPMAALLFWFFGDFRYGALLFVVKIVVKC